MKGLMIPVYIITLLLCIPIVMFIRTNMRVLSQTSNEPYYYQHTTLDGKQAEYLQSKSSGGTVEDNGAVEIDKEQKIDKAFLMKLAERMGGSFVDNSDISDDESLIVKKGKHTKEERKEMPAIEREIKIPISYQDGKRKWARSEWELQSSIYIYNDGKRFRRIGKEYHESINEDSFDISLVATGSLNRAVVMPIYASRWDGPVVFVIHLKSKEVSTFEAFLQKEEAKELRQSRIRLITYVSEKGSFFYENYPINILRNIGIRNTHTTHFMVLDIDMWISQDARRTLLQLPREILASTRTAIVLPAIFHKGWEIESSDFQEQVKRVKNKVPYTLQDLSDCFKNGRCSTMKNGLTTHMYVTEEWKKDHTNMEGKAYYNYTCWHNYSQEPYVITARNDTISWYYEGLINYGFNKIVFIETLRAEGYRFILAGNVFAFDLPHSPSRFQKEHAGRKSGGNFDVSYYFMQTVYKRNKGRNGTLPLCKKY